MPNMRTKPKRLFHCLCAYVVVIMSTMCSGIFVRTFSSSAGQILTYLTAAAIPAAFVVVEKFTREDLKHTLDDIPKQIGWGLLGGAALTFLLALPLLLAGVKTTAFCSPPPGSVIGVVWEFFFKLVVVGVVEEFVFRGYFLYNFTHITGSKAWGTIISSAMFALWHYIETGSLFFTAAALISGILLCVFKYKIKNFTIGSSVLSRGLYECALLMISVFVR